MLIQSIPSCVTLDHITFLCLCFLICKMGILTPYLPGLLQDEMSNVCEAHSISSKPLNGWIFIRK